MEIALFEAVNNRASVTEFLQRNPTVNVNWRYKTWACWTPLHFACVTDNEAAISALLAHPDIDVNPRDEDGCTPFFMACFGTDRSCVRLLLRDERTLIDEADVRGDTGLSMAVSCGHLEIIELILAYRGQIYTSRLGALRHAIDGTTRGGQAAILLERFRENPSQTRYQLRLKLGLCDETASELFALVVFLSDGLLKIRVDPVAAPAVRFFSICNQLSLELQMMLCHRVVGSSKDLIPGKDREAVFKELAARF